MSYGSIDDALSSEAQRTQVEFFIAVSLSLIDSFFYYYLLFLFYVYICFIYFIILFYYSVIIVMYFI